MEPAGEAFGREACFPFPPPLPLVLLAVVLLLLLPLEADEERAVQDPSLTMATFSLYAMLPRRMLWLWSVGLVRKIDRLVGWSVGRSVGRSVGCLVDLQLVG